MWWPWTWPRKENSRTNSVEELSAMTSTVLCSLGRTRADFRGAPGYWEGRASFKCLSRTKYLTSRRGLITTKGVATPRIYQIFETVCEGQVSKRILVLYFMLERMIITTFFLNQMKVFMLSQKTCEISKCHKDKCKISYFKLSPQ